MFKRSKKQIFALLFLFLIITTLNILGFFIPIDLWIYEKAKMMHSVTYWLASWEIISLFGNGVLLLFLILCLFYLCIKKQGFATFKKVFIISLILYPTNYLLKNVFQITRPEFISTWFSPTSHSFPSGHTYQSIWIFFILPVFYKTLFKKQLIPHKLAFTVILLVGFSRIILGYHWFSDVIAGWLWGFFIYFVCKELAFTFLKRDDKILDTKCLL